MMAGLGARFRARRNTYLFVEGSPRLAGYDAGHDDDQRSASNNAPAATCSS